MPADCLAVDAGVLITLAAAMGGWDVCDALDTPVVVSPAVWEELRRGSPGKPGTATQLRPRMTLWSREIRAKRKGYPLTLKEAIGRIRAAGIWLGKEVENAALAAAEEKQDNAI